MSQQKILWDLGTAYDFFVSLEVLHYPDRYGVRGVWAAGMRSRLPNAERDFLEQIVGSVTAGAPLRWISKLPPPKDSATALRKLGEMRPDEMLIRLMDCDCDNPGPWEAVTLSVIERRAWDESDVKALRELVKKHDKKITRKDIETRLDWWSRPEEFGKKYVKALTAYYEVFFAEEERRIYPALQDSLEKAQELSETMSVIGLVEALSQGVNFGETLDVDTLVLAPSFWSSPLIYYGDYGDSGMIMLFGGRPANASLIPGEVVPDALLRSLKALSDPTRLKIMRYLSAESLTPTQLSHKLRLRAPTVVRLSAWCNA